MNFSDFTTLSRKAPAPPDTTILNPTQIIERELSSGASLSIVILLDALIKSAHIARASDIHLDPLAKGLRVRFRVDGVLQDAYIFPPEIQNEVISRLKILCSLRTDE